MTPHPLESVRSVGPADRLSLCEALDRVLNKGAVVAGEMTISVADIDLIYLGVQVVLTSIEKARDVVTAGASADARTRILTEADDGVR